MSAKSKAPGTQEKRFAAYLERLASAAGHADRHEPLKSYCTGLLLPIKRKSVEPMAARLAPDNVRRMHQSLHHLVADAPWDDAALLAEVRQYALGAMEANGPIEAWIVDDTGFVKKGTHSSWTSGSSGCRWCASCQSAWADRATCSPAQPHTKWRSRPSGSKD